MIEQRLREALNDGALTARDVRPLISPDRGRRPLWVYSVPTGLVVAVSLAAFAFAERPTAMSPTVGTAVAGRPTEVAPTLPTGTPSTPRYLPALTVYLCKADSPFEVCRDRDGVTPSEKSKIKNVMAGLPEVEAVFAQSADLAFEEFMKRDEYDQFVDVLRPSDMPESIRVRVRDGADRHKIAEIAKKLPGV